MLAGIYLHIPFCKSRCSYCDFATDVYRESGAVDRYVDAICREIRSGSESNVDVDTIYFGGGTPSLLQPDQVERILTEVRSQFHVSVDVEITLEMNPATVTAESLAACHSLGVNRASFGVQTFDDRALKLLARGHDAADAGNTFAMLRDAGFDNVSLDLIAGLPGQTIDDWQANLDAAIVLGPEHISLYLLEIHSGTPLAEQVRTGRQPMPDEAVAAEMYEIMLDRLGSAGYEQYEISNFCKPGFQSRHNSKYWQLDPVYGFGVSAHSFDGNDRYANERETAKYVELITTRDTAQVSREAIDQPSELAFLGLRMEPGLRLDEYKRRFAIDLEEKFADELSDVMAAGLIEIVDGHLRLTRKGKLFSNEVFSIFV